MNEIDALRVQIKQKDLEIEFLREQVRELIKQRANVFPQPLPPQPSIYPPFYPDIFSPSVQPYTTD